MNDGTAAAFPQWRTRPGRPPIGLTRDEQGRVYAWDLGGRRGGFAGCYVHEAGGWRRILETAGNPKGCIVAIIPVKEGRVLVCPYHSPAFIRQMGNAPPGQSKLIDADIALLDDEKFATREEAERRLIGRGDRAVANLKAAIASAAAPEVRMRITRILKAIAEAGARPRVDGRELTVTQAIFHAGPGDAYLWAQSAGDAVASNTPDIWHLDSQGLLVSGPRELLDNPPTGGLAADRHGGLYIAGQSLLLLKDRKQSSLTDVADGPILRIFGLDKDGRIYLQTASGVIGIDPAAPETRPALPVASDAIRQANVCMTADGKMCAKLAGSDHGMLSLFENGHWTEVPTPENDRDQGAFAYIQPLRDGGLIAQQQMTRDALLLEGGRWEVFDDLHKLIEAKSDLLIKQIDNSLPGLDGQCRIRIDARHALWCAEVRHLAVWDSGHWLPEANAQLISPLKDCLPVFGGRLMLLSNRRGRASLARIESGSVTSSFFPAAASQAIAWYEEFRDLDVDAAGRCFLPRRDGSVLLFDASGFRLLPEIGLPRLADSRGRVWFVDSQRQVLTALQPDGRHIEFHDASLTPQCSIVEDKDHTYWLWTPRGLVHLSLEQDRVIRSVGPVYSRGIPATGLTGMWIEPHRTLWLATRERLYRVQLP